MICACPHCGKRLKVNDSFAGRQATCPKCKQPFMIPKAPLETANKQGAPKTIPTAVQVTTPNSVPQPPQVRSSPQTTGQAPPIPPKVEAHGAGLKNAPVPPPLPRSFTTKKEPGPGGLPPLPPKIPGRPPAIPGTVGTVAGAAINRVVGSLARALSIRKLVFFLLVGTAICLLLGLLSYVLMKIAMPSDSLDADLESIDAALESIERRITFVSIVIVIVAVGMIGVLIGGVAYLTHMEEQGRSIGIGDAFRFCGRKFGSLFGGAVLFMIVVLLVLGVTNGFIMLLNRSRTVGSLLAALLFLPHFALNLVSILAAVISVIIPCAIAVENKGPMVAISRFVACVRRDTGHLMVHFIITAFFSILTMVMVSFVLGVLLFTFPINAGASIGIPGLTSLSGQAGTTQGFDVEFASRDSHVIGERLVRNIRLEPGIGNGTHNCMIMWRDFDIKRLSRDLFDRPGQIKDPWGLKLRLFFAALVIASAVSYSAVFWIVSFTNYYRAVRPKILMIAPHAGPVHRQTTFARFKQ